MNFRFTLYAQFFMAVWLPVISADLVYRLLTNINAFLL